VPAQALGEFLKPPCCGLLLERDQAVRQILVDRQRIVAPVLGELRQEGLAPLLVRSGALGNAPGRAGLRNSLTLHFEFSNFAPSRVCPGRAPARG
jgi:hypothetical protein